MGIIKTVILADAIKKAGKQTAQNAPPPTQNNYPPQQPQGNYYQASVSGSRDVNGTSYRHQPWCNGCCGGQCSGGGGAQYAGSAAQYYPQQPNQFAGNRSVSEHGLGGGNVNGQCGVDTPPSYEVGGAAASAELPSPVSGDGRK